MGQYLGSWLEDVEKRQKIAMEMCRVSFITSLSYLRASFLWSNCNRSAWYGKLMSHIVSVVEDYPHY